MYIQSNSLEDVITWFIQQYSKSESRTALSLMMMKWHLCFPTLPHYLKKTETEA